MSYSKQDILMRDTAVSFYLMLGWSVFVPSTPSEVNGLMHGPWTKRFIHPNPPFTEDFARTRIKAEIKDWTEGVLSACKKSD